MICKRTQVNTKLSAYDPDPMSLDANKKSDSWEYPQQGNSWKQAIMNEIENLKKFDLFKIIPLFLQERRFSRLLQDILPKERRQALPNTKKLTNGSAGCALAVTRRLEGVHYNRVDAYAPVPTWSTIKLQLALTSRLHLQLKAFDCVAAYLQADLKNPLYVYPPKGLMQELGQDPNKIWMLKKALCGWPPSGRIWFDTVSTWLHDYGFRTLGNFGTFMMLDWRDLPGNACGIILLNLYSDNGLGSTDNSALWNSFMVDFKVAFSDLQGM